jgi:hypothetical protein
MASQRNTANSTEVSQAKSSSRATCPASGDRGPDAVRVALRLDLGEDPIPDRSGLHVGAAGLRQLHALSGDRIRVGAHHGTEAAARQTLDGPRSHARNVAPIGPVSHALSHADLREQQEAPDHVADLGFRWSRSGGAAFRTRTDDLLTKTPSTRPQRSEQDWTNNTCTRPRSGRDRSEDPNAMRAYWAAYRGRCVDRRDLPGDHMSREPALPPSRVQGEGRCRRRHRRVSYGFAGDREHEWRSSGLDAA